MLQFNHLKINFSLMVQLPARHIAHTGIGNTSSWIVVRHLKA